SRVAPRAPAGRADRPSVPHPVDHGRRRFPAVVEYAASHGTEANGTVPDPINRSATVTPEEVTGHPMPLLSALRLNMTNVPGAGHGERYRAALQMASYADSHGITAIGCEEHHVAATGWLPAPLLLAAAVVGCTSDIRISINALLVPLYEP